jgi:hypothetical protein
MISKLFELNTPRGLYMNAKSAWGPACRTCHCEFFQIVRQRGPILAGCHTTSAYAEPNEKSANGNVFHWIFIVGYYCRCTTLSIKQHLHAKSDRRLVCVTSNSEVHNEGLQHDAANGTWVFNKVMAVR